MRIAVLSDVHGNLIALDAVLAEVADEGFDLVVSGGDVVAGPMPRECLERLAGLGERVRWVMGNADREVIAALDGAALDDPDDPGLIHLRQLFVHPGWWGTGLADRLMAIAVDASRAGGFTRMRLFTPAAQGRARRFYERAGWRPAGPPIDEPRFGMPIIEYARDV